MEVGFLKGYGAEGTDFFYQYFFNKKFSAGGGKFWDFWQYSL